MDHLFVDADARDVRDWGRVTLAQSLEERDAARAGNFFAHDIGHFQRGGAAEHVCGAIAARPAAGIQFQGLERDRTFLTRERREAVGFEWRVWAHISVLFEHRTRIAGDLREKSQLLQLYFNGF